VTFDVGLLQYIASTLKQLEKYLCTHRLMVRRKDQKNLK